MRVLCFGDIFGRPGREAVARALPALKTNYRPDFIVGNAENLAGGKGVNRRTLAEMFSLGFHGFTSGNHIWDNKEVLEILPLESRLIRPANFPSMEGAPCPGAGVTMLQSGDFTLYLVNIMGRVYMDSLDCPFEAIDRILRDIPAGSPILVDFHGEATSEKYAMGFHLDGRVSAVVGTHTHVQTADNGILPGGTAFITDVGLSGSFHSVIGMEAKEVVLKFRTKRRQPYRISERNPGICAVVIDIDEKGLGQRIERIRLEVPLNEEF